MYVNYQTHKEYSFNYEQQVKKTFSKSLNHDF